MCEPASTIGTIGVAATIGRLLKLNNNQMLKDFLNSFNFNYSFKLSLILISFLFITLGLLSSTLHLGHPERAWRSFSQWRSSWLSREGLAAVLTYIPLMIFYLLWFLEMDIFKYFLYSASILSVITIYCTGQMYASLKTVPAWNNVYVTPIYLINGLSIGSLSIYCLTRFYESEIQHLYQFTLLSLALCLMLKIIYWYIISKKIISTANSATGLGKNNNISLFEGPHTGKNFLTTEMINRIKEEKANEILNTNQINYLPILNRKKELVGIVSKQKFLHINNYKIYSRKIRLFVSTITLINLK